MTPPVPAAPARTLWTLAFATVADRGRAQEMARRIVVDGRAARAIAVTSGETTSWRVVAGPFPTRDAADRAGMNTGIPYWVFEGSP